MTISLVSKQSCVRSYQRDPMSCGVRKWILSKVCSKLSTNLFSSPSRNDVALHMEYEIWGQTRLWIHSILFGLDRAAVKPTRIRAFENRCARRTYRNNYSREGQESYWQFLIRSEFLDEQTEVSPWKFQRFEYKLKGYLISKRRK